MVLLLLLLLGCLCHQVDNQTTAVEVHVEGIADFREEADRYKRKTVFALFVGSKDAEGNSWCQDCVAAEPVIQRNLVHAPGDAVFIHCGVGNKRDWQDQGNDFRTDPKLKLKSVPTLLRLGHPQRLEEEQCANDQLVELFLSLMNDGTNKL